MAQINKPSQPLVPPTDIEDVEGIVNEAIASDTTHAPLVNDLVPAVNLPSYVDDVLEFDSVESFPNPGEEGKIYVALDTNYTYRWAGSVYTQVGGSEVDLSDYYRKKETDNLLDEKADTALIVSLVVDEQTEHGMRGHVDNKAAVLLLENPDRPVRFQLNGILISPQTKLVDNGLEYNVMTGETEETSYINVFVSEDSNSWELTTTYGIETLTNGLVTAQNNITALQDNVGELHNNVTELQQALPVTVPATGSIQGLTNGDILGHGVFEQDPPIEGKPTDTNFYCTYYNAEEYVWQLILNQRVYNKFLSTFVETVPSSIMLRNGNDDDMVQLQLARGKSKTTVIEEGPSKIVNTYVYNGIVVDYDAGIQYSVSLRLVSNNGASLSSDIISTPILKPSQVESLVQSAIGDVLNTDF